jgi:hypothetical protein
MMVVIQLSSADIEKQHNYYHNEQRVFRQSAICWVLFPLVDEIILGRGFSISGT